MKFGVREICDVVLRAKNAMKIGDKVFYKNEPVLYFDSLKTSSMEGAATTVYAQGGRGNARLIAWEGERTVTFTMEDALLSPTGLAILTGAGLVSATSDKPVITHVAEQTDLVALKTASGTDATTIATTAYAEITLSNKPYVGKNAVATETVGELVEQAAEDYIYVMLLDENGEVYSEPYIASEISTDISSGSGHPPKYTIRVYKNDIKLSDNSPRVNDFSKFANGMTVLVDYYVAHQEAYAYQADITPDMFGGNFYLEASTLFRDSNGVDLPAEFIIPNCKVQSNFTFTMASSGDPSTFTFTMDAFPDYTRWDKTKKVFASLQVIGLGEASTEMERLGTAHDYNNTAIELGSDGIGIGGGTGTQAYTVVKTAYDALQADALEK